MNPSVAAPLLLADQERILELACHPLERRFRGMPAIACNLCLHRHRWRSLLFHPVCFRRTRIRAETDFRAAFHNRNRTRYFLSLFSFSLERWNVGTLSSRKCQLVKIKVSSLSIETLGNGSFEGSCASRNNAREVNKCHLRNIALGNVKAAS